MVDFVKKKIVEKLAKFTKDLKPSDISLSFLTGKGHLSNLELNAQFISEVLQLPPWVAVSRVVCDTIRAKVPFTSLNTDPVNFYIGQVLIEISTCTDATATTPEKNSSFKFGGKPSKYGLIEKVIDGMRVEIRSILVFFKDPSFHAQLEMTEILVESTSYQWEVVPLNKARMRIEDEDSVINYKVCSWSTLKIEGWSTTSRSTKTNNQLRLIAGETKIHIAFKRNVSDSSLMCYRISMHLGDLIWILTQSQLRAVSILVQSLMDAAVRAYQLKKGEEGDSDSMGSLDSICSNASSVAADNSGGKKRGDRAVKSKKLSKSATLKSKEVEARISKYREGKVNLPPYEVIQNSFHLKTGNVDLDFCDDVSIEDTIQGSIMIKVVGLVVDLYLDQPAIVGRAHWNKANDIISRNSSFSKKLVVEASKTQFVDLPSVSLGHLRERSVVIRCADFSVGSLKHQSSSRASGHTLPIITSDKKTFNIPDDNHNPAFQVGVSLYFYPDKYASKFLVPRPNVFVYMSPVHVNLHQESCLWLVEFVLGVIQTVNLELAREVKDEGKSFLEERKAESVPTHQLAGLDAQLQILFTKVTMPLPDAANDGRPKALQIETAAINAKNSPLNVLLGDSDFSQAIHALREGWLMVSQDTPQFPHYQNDLRALPLRLQALLQQKVRAGRRRGESNSEAVSFGASGSVSFSGSSDGGVGVAPEENRAEMMGIEGWYISTCCVHVAFVNNYTHEATLHTKNFINDFPVHIWFFLPPSSLDSASGPSPSDTPPSPADPKFSFLVHVPQDIRLELERLQLLFLMRLKDSANIFKSSLMKFLDIGKMDNDTSETLPTHVHEDTAPNTISGCVVMSCVEASILLPTLYTSRVSQATNTHTSHDQESHDQGEELFPEALPPSGRSSRSALSAHDTRYTLRSSVSPASSQTSLTADASGGGSGSRTPSPAQHNLVPGDRTSPSQTSLTADASSLLGGQASGVSPSPTSLTAPSPQASSLSPSASVSSLPIISDGDRRGPPPPRPPPPQLAQYYASTTDLGQREEGVAAQPPLRSYSVADMSSSRDPDSLREGGVNSHMTTPLNESAKSRDPSQERTTEEEFVIVKYPTNKTTPTSIPHPPSNPTVVVDKEVCPSSTSSNPLSSTSSKDPLSSTSSGVTNKDPSLLEVSSSTSFAKSTSSGRTTPSDKTTPSGRTTPSVRRQKSPSHLRSIPQFILHAQVHHIMVVPNVKSGEISVRVSADTVSLRELTEDQHKGMKEMFRRKSNASLPPPDSSPSIKARLEVGKQVGRFYPAREEEEPDIIVIGMAEGLDISLLLPNITVMKDFFDDELEPLLPLPLHLKVETTRAVLVEDITHSADHTHSMAVGVEQLEVHRGRELAEGSDIFLEKPNGRGMSGSGIAMTTNDGADADSHLLLQSFSSFISVFEAHLQHHGRVHLPQPQHVADLLQELKASLTTPNTTTTTMENSPPPMYSVVTPATYSYIHSSAKKTSSEVLHLRRENESLRQVQRECEKLAAQLKGSQGALEKQQTDLIMVTHECKRTKDQLVSYKQVMEKQQEHIERLLTENFNLSRPSPPPPPS